MSESPNPAGPPPNWGPQQPWAGPAARGGPPKWVLGAVALAVVIAATVGATLLFSQNNPDETTANGPEQVRPNAASETKVPAVASSKDTGPVTVITDDPTCSKWGTIYTALTAVEQNGWSQRNASVPASGWTAAQRTAYEAVGQAMRTSADQLTPLAAQTPHRVMRHLYEQTIAYQRAYADSLAMYAPDDDPLAQVADSTGRTLSSICESIANGAATAAAGLIPAADDPTASSPATGEPTRFFQPPTDPVCAQWHSLVAKYTAQFAAWRAIDPNIPAAQWNPAQRAINDAVAPAMVAFADEVESMAATTQNGPFQDIAVLAGQYRRAFAAVLPTYTPVDALLTTTASAATGAIDEACTATEG